MNRREAVSALGVLALGESIGAVSQPAPEIVIRGGRIVNADGSRMADVRISGERIVALGEALSISSGTRVIEARGKLVIPGGIDPHTHLQGSFVDDLTTGTAAALAGGITTVGTFAYPEQGESPVDAMKRWVDEVERSAIGDVFFHASVWPPSVGSPTTMSELAALGQPSHKIFMTRSDYDENQAAVVELVEAARDAGVVTLMHCEDSALLSAAVRQLRADGRSSLEHYAESRPEAAEVAATARATALCELTGAPMHFVHLSSERALDAARSKRTEHLPLTIETRPLYLYFTEEWLRGPEGPLYIGQPPLRSAANVASMWQGLADGRIDFLATDHAPWTREQKLDPKLDIERLRPGVSDLRFMRPVLYSEGVRRGRLSVERFVEVTATAAAKTFGLYPERGVIEEGAFADVVIFDPDLERIASAEDDPSRSDYTPFEGWAITGWPVTTLRRGDVVYDNGRVIGDPGSGKPAFRHPRLDKLPIERQAR